ncbi:ATP-binding cassette domain-containing protein [Thermosipho melanesiensis]|nr:ABC transporter ATP-binding protein [Thermosipho melanesiensis]
MDLKDEKGGKIKEVPKAYEFDIEFENVSFKYPDSENYVFKDFNLKIKKGEKILIVGQNGTGKSTLVKLILGYYKPQNGNVRLFGIDVSKWNLKYLRKQIAIVDQEHYVFPGDVKENIRYGNYEEVNKQNLEKILKVTKLDEFMESVRLIGENGIGLSGG